MPPATTPPPTGLLVAGAAAAPATTTRLRLAHELHDSVASAIFLIAIQAGLADQALDRASAKGAYRPGSSRLSEPSSVGVGQLPPQVRCHNAPGSRTG